MKTFKGRITRGPGNHYIIEDSDFDSDSEVENIFTAGNFDILIDGDFIPDDSAGDTTASDDDDEEDLDEILDFAPVEEEFEEVSMEGYFAFGGRLRSRQRRSSQDSFEFQNALPPPIASPTLDELRETLQRRGSDLPEGQGTQVVDGENAVTDSMWGPTNDELLFAATPPEAASNESSRDIDQDVQTNNASEESGETDAVIGDNKTSPTRNNEVISEDGESARTAETDDNASDKEEQTCNPMVSDVEELEENDDALRGDRIGSTTYSERHVIKLLMKWVQELPKYSEDGIKENEEESKEPGPSTATTIDKTRFLENDFEEEMALLWDMSFEPDVMSFLVENNAFNIIRETLDVSCCARLTEIGLGIMANILSQQSIVEDFSIHDASLKLVETVIAQAVKMPRVPVLIQVFAVLRRITWFLRSVAYVNKWMDLLLSQEFLNCANFILSSSTNALLLGNVIVTIFTVLEALSPEIEDDREQKDDEDEQADDPEKSHNYFGKALMERKKDFENYRPFCETGFVPALCEGISELMKNPKPRKIRKLTSTRDKCPTAEDTTAERALEEMEVPIPDGLVQNAILNGLSTLYYLFKTPNGKEIIRENGSAVLNFLLDFFRKFSVCTDAICSSSSFDYLALAMSLLSFCHKGLEAMNEEAINIPIGVARKLMVGENDESQIQVPVFRFKQKDGQEQDSRTFIALVVHEYIESLADSFGEEIIISYKKSNHVKFFQTVDKIVSEHSEISEEQAGLNDA